MKKTRMIYIIAVIAVITVLTLTGCGVDKEKVQADFTALIGAPASADTIRKTADYIEEYRGKLSDRQASEMIQAFEGYLLSYVNNDESTAKIVTLRQYYDEKTGKIDEDSIQDPGDKELYGDLSAGCLKFKVNNSGFVTYLAYDALLEKYKKNLIPALQDLYELKKVEVSQPISEDANLIISWQELTERAYHVEEYIREYRDEPMIKEAAAWLYQNYATIMVMGMQNTPIFNYKTGVFSEEAKASYSKFIGDYPDTTTAWILREYFEYLNEIGYAMNYSDKETSKAYYNTCSWLVTESGKRVFQ